MHELMIAQNIIDIVKEHADKENATKINKIQIYVGELSGVEKDALEFCLPLVSENTIAHGAEVEVNLIPLKIHCKDCNQESHIEPFAFICPECCSKNIKVIQGKDMFVKDIVMECDD